MDIICLFYQVPVSKTPLNRQVPTQALLLGGCQHPVSTPSVDTYLNDIRFGRCQHWLSTPTKGDTALLGVDT